MTNIDFIPSKEDLLAQKNRISKRSAIGRSKNYLKLLDYLLEKEYSTLESGSESKTPKEIEIAIDVFGKGTDFNPGDDATVRVHISNLRKKLETYYHDEGDEEAFFITVPTGGYRVVFTPNPDYTGKSNVLNTKEVEVKEEIKPESKSYFSSYIVVVAIVIISLIIHISLIAFQKDEIKADIRPNTKIRTHEIWGELPKKENLVIIAISEKNMISQNEIGDTTKYSNNKKYLSKSKAIALKNILSLFNDQHKIQFRMVSELTVKDLRQATIIYIGGYESMGMLSNYFDGSSLSLSEQGSLLTVKTSAQSYSAPTDFSDQYVDYGLFAKVDGPREHKIYVMAGYTDSALLQLSWFFTKHEKVFSQIFNKAIKKYELSSYNNFELLFKVQSLDGIDLSHEIVYGSHVDNKAIWK